MIKPRVEQRLDVTAQHGRAHDHWISAGEQDTGHLRAVAEVGDHPVHVVGCDLEIGLSDELRPAETVRAVRMAGLTVPGEQQHRLRILVLNAWQRFVLVGRHVEDQLPSRMWIELQPDAPGGPLHLRLGRAAREKVRHAP